MWLPVALLWLAGNALRLTILAVPPVIALIRDDFALNATQVGLLSSIPPALFAIAALAGSLLVARLGIMGALVGGLLIIAVGSALRGLSSSYAALLATTIVMSAGVAIMQPIMPTAVRQWLPRRIGLGTAIYTNGLLVGELFPVWLTIPLVLPAVHGDWRMAFVLWSVPVLVIAIVVFMGAPRSSSTGHPAAAPAKWLPDWHRGLVWRLGVMFGCINALYFSTNAFIPIYLTSAGRPDLISGALTALNLGQVPASLLLLATAGRLQRRAWPYLASGALSLAAVLGLVFDVGPWTTVGRAVRFLRRGRTDPRTDVARVAVRAARCRAHGRRYVHHQLWRGGTDRDRQRAGMGRERVSLRRRPWHCARRGRASSRA